MKAFLAAGLILIALAANAQSQSSPQPEEKTQVKIGFRADVEPFSYRIQLDGVWDEKGQNKDRRRYKGFLADLCYDIFEGSGYYVQEVEVTAENRFDMLNDGSVQVLCDPITMRYSDRTRTASGVYSPIVFASGVSYLQRRSRARRQPVFVGYVRGTTAWNVAERTCNIDMFKAVPPEQRVSLTEMCASAKATLVLKALHDAVAITLPPTSAAHLNLAKAALQDCSDPEAKSLLNSIREGDEINEDSRKKIMECRKAAFVGLAELALQDCSEPKAMDILETSRREENVQEDQEETIMTCALNRAQRAARGEARARESEENSASESVLDEVKLRRARWEEAERQAGALASNSACIKVNCADEIEKLRKLFGEEDCSLKDDPDPKESRPPIVYRFCGFKNHQELIKWFCGPHERRNLPTRVYIGDREIILGKLKTWNDNTAKETHPTCDVESKEAADDLTYEPYVLMTSKKDLELAERLKRGIYEFFSFRDKATNHFETYFRGDEELPKRMSPALAYLFLLNAVEEDWRFVNPPESSRPGRTQQENVEVFVGELAEDGTATDNHKRNPGHQEVRASPRPDGKPDYLRRLEIPSVSVVE